ncbi:MAG: methyltransferase domain-containing protein [Planctomycetaceae bacterium]|nr:methyltransferase domain-containing protein [Planctomycetaceae bacterium]
MQNSTIQGHYTPMSHEESQKEPETSALPDVISNWKQEQFCWNGQEIQLTIPADPDELLELLEETPEQSNCKTKAPFDPYWGHLWPAAREMARLVPHFLQTPGTSVLELGCGSGLIGIAALAAGMNVTFSDNQPEALKLAGYNAKQNGFKNYQLCLYDWLNPPRIEPFPIVIASDVLYEERFHEPLLNVLDQVTTSDGETWIADPGRSLLPNFLRTAQAHNFEFEIYDKTLTQKLFPAIGHFQLLKLKRG